MATTVHNPPISTKHDETREASTIMPALERTSDEPSTLAPVPSPISRAHPPPLTLADSPVPGESKVQDVVVEVDDVETKKALWAKRVAEMRAIKAARDAAIAKAEAEAHARAVQEYETYWGVCQPVCAKAAASSTFVDEASEGEEKRGEGEVPRAFRIQYGYLNDKPPGRTPNPGDSLYSGRLQARKSHRRCRLICYRLVRVEDDGSAVFHWGAVVYNPPMERVRKYGNKNNGFDRPSQLKIPKGVMPGHRLTALKRCMEEDHTVRVTFDADRPFGWNAKSLGKVRSAIHRAMSQPGAMVGGSGGSGPLEPATGATSSVVGPPSPTSVSMV